MWLGFALTAFFLWVALRDVDFLEVGRLIAGANWALLLGVSVPSYLAVVHLRGRRWKHLTDPLQPIPVSSLSRAVAIGYMVNNVLPLRVGEVVRVWVLARDAGANSPALFGTVVLERVIDAITVVALAAVVLAIWGASSDNLMARGALALVPVAFVPAAFLVWLRAAPESVVGVSRRLLGPFPERVSLGVEKLLRQFAAGLGSLRSGVHLFWIAVDSLAIWAVGSTLPILAAFWALEIELGSPLDTLVGAWAVLVAVAIAVALPSSPGFFGVYHYAAKWALLRFGISAKTAVALGTMVHSVMWVTLTLLGFLALRAAHTSLRELDAAASAAEEPHSR